MSCNLASIHPSIQPSQPIPPVPHGQPIPSHLTSLVIPSHLTNLTMQAFRHCQSMMVDVADQGQVRRKLRGVLVPAGLRKSLGVGRRDSGKSSVTNDVEQHLPGIVLNHMGFAVCATIHHGFEQPSIKEHALVLGQTSPDRRLVWLVC